MGDFQKWMAAATPDEVAVRREGPAHAARPSLADRFWTKVEVGNPLGCWTWTGSRNGDGYGLVKVDGRTRRAHRVAYALLVEELPEAGSGPRSGSVTLDHLCRNRACVNPDHLEPVTLAENILRGRGAGAQAARKTHCKRGHRFTPENMYVPRSGGRECVACRPIRKLEAAGG